METTEEFLFYLLDAFEPDVKAILVTRPSTGQTLASPTVVSDLRATAAEHGLKLIEHSTFLAIEQYNVTLDETVYRVVRKA